MEWKIDKSSYHFQQIQRISLLKQVYSQFQQIRTHAHCQANTMSKASVYDF